MRKLVVRIGIGIVVAGLVLALACSLLLPDGMVVKGPVLNSLTGRSIEGMEIAGADDFAYLDPVDGSASAKQGVRILFQDGSRIVMRLSGTGTEGATLRLYLERYAPGPDGLGHDPQEALAPVIRAAHLLAGISDHTGRTTPDVVT